MEKDTLIRAYGVNWKREQTGWEGHGPAANRMLGQLKEHGKLRSTIADHWMQWGIYVLHRDSKPAYVGIASQLGRRIKEHLNDHHGKWDQFSWFGSRDVIFEGRSPFARIVVDDPTDTDGPLRGARFGRVWLDIEAMLHRAFLPDGTFFDERGRVPYFGRRATEWAQLPQTVVKELGPKANQANAIQVSPDPDLEMLAAEANAIITETQDLPDRLLQLLREIGALAIRSRDTGERTDMDEVDPGMVHMLDRVKGQGSAQE